MNTPHRIRALLSCALLVSITSLISACAPRAEAAPRPVTPRGDLTEEELSNIQVFETWKGSVVFITTSSRVMDFWTRDVMSVPRGTGSGFVWDEQGHIVTNLHVIAGAAEATVKLADGRDYPASLVGVSEAHDIAVLKISPTGKPLSPVAIGTSDDLRVGQKVFAIGNPFGLDWTLTTGIVSALDRSLDNESGGVNRHLVQTDAAINPGNSGGPLLDSAGRLIGMNTAIYSPSGASAGVGFAVPVDTVNRVVPEIIAHGHYTPPSLDVETDDMLSRAVARELGVRGVAVLRGGEPFRGARMGERNFIVPGDVITSIEGKEVTSSAQLAAILDDYKIGDEVRVDVWREGKRVQLRARLRAGGGS
ncbi:MAG TPA: trypsin-like peptidase domain-containing protein [Steroidobacteraceae bacterium]|jgi:S1-C subfamily serine protease|nr:trypsin-like peptidase domain-containing protein [Steroidobacteraceae bacterium]